jgi:hypothetical protein
MSIPTQPTKTTIVTEALTRFYDGAAPTAAEITRGENYGLEKVKRDLMLIGHKWRPLIRTAYDITKIGVSSYPCPADFEDMISVGLMSGDHSGVLSDVTSASNVTLAADEDATQAEAVGKWLLITSGTGADQAQVIDDFSATTKVAALADAYAIPPIATDGYIIVNSIAPLREMPIELYDRYQHPGIPGTPKRFAVVPNQSVGDCVLYPVPDAVKGLKFRYYADLRLMDTDITLYNTILRRWAAVFEQGVFVWKLAEDDDRYPVEMQIYQSMLLGTMAADLDGYNPDEAQKAAAEVK